MRHKKPWRCRIFGHDWQYLGEWLPVYVERHGLRASNALIPVMCRRCPEVTLQRPPFAYEASWRTSEEIHWKEALRIADQRAREARQQA